MRNRVGIAILLAMAVLSITLLYAGKGPMQASHWDAPIYLERSQEIVTSAAFSDYARYAELIAERLPAYRVEPDAYTPYWGFMRLGHSLILAMVTAWSGAGLDGIQAAFHLYIVIWVLAITLTGLLAYLLLRLLATEMPIHVLTLGTVLAVGLSLVSDSTRYMSGNLVAEVPALLLFSLSCYLLLLAQRYRSILLAVGSGAAGFALYTVKMEAVWGYLVFLPLITWTLYRVKAIGSGYTLSEGKADAQSSSSTNEAIGWANEPKRIIQSGLWLTGSIWSAATALLLFILYSWYFWPLTDPRLFLTFAAAHAQQATNAVAPFKLWVAAGGLLWLGVVAGVIYCRDRRMLGFSLAWLLLLTLPYLSGLISGTPAQIRMYMLNLVPLMVMAAYGMACLLNHLKQRRAGRLVTLAWFAAALCLGFVSHTETYRWLRELPGGWRLQQVKAFLSVPPYERIDYPLDQLASISEALYHQSRSYVLILGEEVPEEYLNLIAYMGPAPRRSKIELYALRPAEDHGRCGRRLIRFDRADVFFCLDAPDNLQQLKEKGILVLRLERTSSDPPKRAQVLARTADLTLVRVQ